MAKERQEFYVKSDADLSIEVDSQAGAIYMRFKETPVVRTVEQPSTCMFAAIDLDSEGAASGRSKGARVLTD